MHRPPLLLGALMSAAPLTYDDLIAFCCGLHARGQKLGVAIVKRQRPPGERVKLLKTGPLGTIRAIERRDDGQFIIRADFCPARARDFFATWKIEGNAA